MSQQKFASNVIEKCLAFGSPEERQILVNEMLGTSDENEPLQVWPFSSLIFFNISLSVAGDYLFKYFRVNFLSAEEISLLLKLLCNHCSRNRSFVFSFPSQNFLDK
jgi:hypothetical protein